MAAPTNSGESDMAAEDFCLSLSSLLSPRWSPPLPFLPSTSSMVMQYQGSNQSMDNQPQNQEHDDIVDPAPYLAGAALLQQQRQKLRQNWIEASDWRPRGGIMTMNNQGFEESNMGFEEESEEMMMNCFYFPPSSPPLYRPMPRVFFVSSEQENISLALSCQHILEDKSGALHVIYGEEGWNIVQLLVFNCFRYYVDNKSDDWHEIARAAGVLPKGVELLVDNIIDEFTLEETEGTLRRINRLEQQDEAIVGQPVYEAVGVVQQLIQNRGGELDVIIGGGVFMVNGLEWRDSQGPPTTPETLLICQAKVSLRVWLGHGGQWAIELRSRCNHLDIGSFTTVEDAISTYEVVARWTGWTDLTGFPGLFENENRSKLLLQLPLTAQELNPVEVVGTSSEGTRDCIMADQAKLDSGCFGKRRTKEKNPERVRRRKKTNGVRIAISLDDILQTKGMSLKEAANHLGVSITKLKSSCRDYGIQRWPPRNEHKLIRQSLPNETLANVDQERFPQLSSHPMPSNYQALTATVDTNIFFEKEILSSQFLPTARQENPDSGFGNDEDEAVGMEVEGIWEDVMVEAQLNSGCSRKGKRKEKSPGGEGGNNGTTGVRITITMEDILKVKGMLLNDAAKHLEVSRSTLKRVCRENGIKRWPPRKEHELISQTHPSESPLVEHELISQTRPNESLAVEHELISQTRPNESPTVVVDQEQTPQLNPDTFLPCNQVSTTIDTKSVKLKARYEGSTVTFRLSQPLRKVELEQEVKKRLPLEAGTYNINYKDEDGDLVLIACDDDLEECISSSTPLGSRCHVLFLNLGT